LIENNHLGSKGSLEELREGKAVLDLENARCRQNDEAESGLAFEQER
jgi:hypothetical protein